MYRVADGTCIFINVPSTTPKHPGSFLFVSQYVASPSTSLRLVGNCIQTADFAQIFSTTSLTTRETVGCETPTTSLTPFINPGSAIIYLKQISNFCLFDNPPPLLSVAPLPMKWSTIHLTDGRWFFKPILASIVESLWLPPFLVHFGLASIERPWKPKHLYLYVGSEDLQFVSYKHPPTL